MMGLSNLTLGRDLGFEGLIEQGHSGARAYCRIRHSWEHYWWNGKAFQKACRLRLTTSQCEVNLDMYFSLYLHGRIQNQNNRKKRNSCGPKADKNEETTTSNA